MDGMVDLNAILTSMAPRMLDGDFVFCSVSGSLGDYIGLDPVVVVEEAEGLTLVLPVKSAIKENFRFEGTFRRITLTVHSSLEAVGLTAAVSSKLSANGIPANVVAGFYHDHIFVPSDKAEEALKLLQSFGGGNE